MNEQKSTQPERQGRFAAFPASIEAIGKGVGAIVTAIVAVIGLVVALSSDEPNTVTTQVASTGSSQAGAVGEILSPVGGTEAEEALNVVVRLDGLDQQEEVWILVEPSRRNGCFPHAVPYRASQRGTSTTGHEFSEVLVGPRDAADEWWLLSLVATEPDASQRLRDLARDVTTSDDQPCDRSGLTQLSQVEIRRLQTQPTSDLADSEATQDDPAPAEIPDIVAGPVLAPGISVSGEASQAGAMIDVVVEGPAEGLEAGHAYFNLDGDPGTGMTQRNGADAVLEGEWLYVWSLDHCAPDDADQFWCWDTTTRQELLYERRDTPDGNVQHVWKLEAEVICKLSGQLTFTAGVKLETGDEFPEHRSSDPSDPLTLNC